MTIIVAGGNSEGVARATAVSVKFGSYPPDLTETRLCAVNSFGLGPGVESGEAIHPVCRCNG